MQNANEHLSSICDQVLHSDTSIRFVGIPNKMGKLAVSRYRDGLGPDNHRTGNRNSCHRISFKDEYKKGF